MAVVYVARRECGCVVAAHLDASAEAFDDKERMNLRKLASDVLRIWVRAGWRVSHVAPQDVVVQWFSECPHVTRQKPLGTINPSTGEISNRP